MRVGVVPSEVVPCFFYRAAGPARAVEATGGLEVVELPEALRLRGTNRRHGPNSVVGLVEVPDVDVIVFTRGVFPERIHEVIGLLQREGVAVVVDYDDAYDRLPPQLHSLYKINPTLNPYYNWQHAKNAARLADVVTVSTPALQRYRPDAVVLRNFMPERYLSLPSTRDDRPTVGWAGTIHGHPGDLRVPGRGVADAVRDHDGRFVNIGDGVDVKRDLGLDRPPAVTGIVSFEDYPTRLTQLHVAIAPLAANQYTKAKSALKLLEGLAAGAQAVGSSTPEYERLVGEVRSWCETAGVPPLAAIAPKPRAWRREVGTMLDRHEQAEELAQAARAFVRERYLMEARAGEFADAWELAVKRRRGLVAA